MSIISQEEVTWRGAPRSELKAELRFWLDRQGERWRGGGRGEGSRKLHGHQKSPPQ